MLTDTTPPKDTIELLLREIQAQLRRRAARARRATAPAAMLLAVALATACAPEAADVATSASSARTVPIAAPVVAAASVAYVDHDHACRDEPHASTPADPYCEVQPSLPLTGEVTVHLAASETAYRPITLSGEQAIDVTVLGPDAKAATIHGAGTSAVSLSALHGSPVRFTGQRLTLTGDAELPGVWCVGQSGQTTLVLSHVLLTHSHGPGLVASGCDTTVERSIVRDNDGGGLAISSSSYAVAYDFITRNHGAGVALADATGILSHLTITRNDAPGSAGLVCLGNSNQLTDSILVDNHTRSSTLTGTDAQLDPRCAVNRIASGPRSTRGLGCAPRFVGEDDAHLDLATEAAAAQNRDCVLGVATTTALDLDDERALGIGNLGADETPQFK